MERIKKEKIKVRVLVVIVCALIGLCAVMGMQALTNAQKTEFNLGTNYEAAHNLKVELNVNGNYITIFNSQNPSEMNMGYVQSVSNDTISFKPETLVANDGTVSLYVSNLESDKYLSFTCTCGSEIITKTLQPSQSRQEISVDTGVTAGSAELGSLVINISVNELKSAPVTLTSTYPFSVKYNNQTTTESTSLTAYVTEWDTTSLYYKAANNLLYRITQITATSQNDQSLTKFTVNDIEISLNGTSTSNLYQAFSSGSAIITATWEYSLFRLDFVSLKGVSSITANGQLFSGSSFEFAGGTEIVIDATISNAYELISCTKDRAEGEILSTTLPFTFVMPADDATIWFNAELASLTSVAFRYNNVDISKATVFAKEIDASGNETTNTISTVWQKAKNIVNVTNSNGYTKLISNTYNLAITMGNDMTNLNTTEGLKTEITGDVEITVTSKADSNVTDKIIYQYNPGYLGTYATPFAKDANNNYPYYIRMGTYSGYAIDWIVLGGCTAEAYTEANATIFSQTTAGVKSGWSYNDNVGFLINGTKAETLLLISQYGLMNKAFDESASICKFFNSPLGIYMKNAIITDIGFSNYTSYIAETTVLKTSVYNSTGTTNDTTKFFLLGWDRKDRLPLGDDFGVCKYFGSDTSSSDIYKAAKSITATTGNNIVWWLRSGFIYGSDSAFAIYGTSDNEILESSTVSVRPVFTLNI